MEMNHTPARKNNLTWLTCLIQAALVAGLLFGAFRIAMFFAANPVTVAPILMEQADAVIDTPADYMGKPLVFQRVRLEPAREDGAGFSSNCLKMGRMKHHEDTVAVDVKYLQATSAAGSTLTFRAEVCRPWPFPASENNLYTVRGIIYQIPSGYYVSISDIDPAAQ